MTEALEVVLDTRDLPAFAKRLREADRQMEKDFLAAEKAAGEIVASAAKAKASSFPGKRRTTRIADSIQVRRRGTKVSVVAGKGAPEAAPLEFGSDGNGGTLRHPVFGNYDVWASQPSHPFLLPAAEENFDAFQAAVGAAVDLFESRL